MMPFAKWFAVDADQLWTAAAAVESWAANVTRMPWLGYSVAAREFGAEPLVAAVGELQRSCDAAVRTLADDLQATAVHLRRNGIRYVTADTDVAADLVDGGRPDAP